MVEQYVRNLNDLNEIQWFLENVLLYNYDPKKLDKIVNKIYQAELNTVQHTPLQSTLKSTKFRNRSYRDDSVRWTLRANIVNELYNNIRLDDDEKIKKGAGGALPKVDAKSGKDLFLLIGLPASGKSSIASTLADEFGAIILDSDFAKRKLPEFKGHVAGASLVHDESDLIIFGQKGIREGFNSLYDICIENSNNIVVPKIGYDYNSINEVGKKFKSEGYKTHLILVCLDRRKATLRALERFLKTGRYVPLSLIFDGYGNDPILTFYRLSTNIFNIEVYFDSFGKISTDVPMGENPKIIYMSEDSPLRIFN